MATSPQDCGDKRKQDVLGGSLYALQEPLRGQRDAGHGPSMPLHAANELPYGGGTRGTPAPCRVAHDTDTRRCLDETSTGAPAILRNTARSLNPPRRSHGPTNHLPKKDHNDDSPDGKISPTPVQDISGVPRTRPVRRPSPAASATCEWR
ncbi:hypothetical protein IscW_ISCW016442 [Ixodes scapularis]|uniref:Uncharacterized protein n=1 Tax=Ixodes scapularis TaxID=6945 RepID=B7P520_IXOSC|nr:hypothetical protein IscW_ISCW016442 [Ixodes scapularis]|eukprot:XP_002406822.1 hypothetical protein IscW_ISCW016442 [Ixodes scapularis]